MTQITSTSLTEERFTRTQKRAARNMGWGATDGALALVSKYLDTYTVLVAAALEKGFRGLHISQDTADNLKSVGADMLALVALQGCISSIAAQDYVLQTQRRLGQYVENEIFAHLLKTWDETKAEKIAKAARKRGGANQRKAIARSVAMKMGFMLRPWELEETVLVGTWLLNAILDGPLFVVVESGDTFAVTITEECLQVSDALVERLTHEKPVMLPSKEPLAPWTDSHTTIDGYRFPLVRKYDKHTQALIKTTIKEGGMGDVLAAVNSIQNTAWTINAPILEMIEWCWANDIKVEGLPPKKDRDVGAPEKPLEEMTEHELFAWHKWFSETREWNKNIESERFTFKRDMAAARYLEDGPFWVGHNLDYRGRVYGISFFNFQRLDYIRGLFRFHEGKPLGPDGLYWLMVHLANTGDFEKVSKKPFEARVDWVITNHNRLLGMAESPKDDLWWTEADCPFQFLAAAQEYAQAVLEGPEGYVCHLPVGFDGSCSGLQHLCAMTRAPEGALVNLVPNETPQDIYQVVADEARRVIESELADEQVGHIARKCLDYGVNRSLVKRNVMTFAYSSKKFGMAGQHKTDLMKPLTDKVSAGELEAHPFEVPEDAFEGEDGRIIVRPGNTAARYLAARVYDTIAKVVSLPEQAMTYLQGIARAMAHENKPVLWHTPAGFPVLLRYPEFETQQMRLWLNDRGVKKRYRPHVPHDSGNIDKTRATNAIAPGFVHSMDACHLMLVVNAARESGITNVALVHDSFGCLPADATRYRQIIIETFHGMYAEHDVLADIRREACDQIDTNSHRIPNVPEYGSLDINEVLQSEYAFA